MIEKEGQTKETPSEIRSYFSELPMFVYSFFDKIE